jgi:peptide/nickel transport system permease protein
VLVEITVGTTVGALAGYYGGWVDAVLMRLTEAMLSIPSLLLLLVMAKFFSSRIPDVELFGRTFSGSVIVIILIIGLTSWMTLARIVRSNVLSLKETEFVLAARALGLPNRRIIMAHILPNTLASIIVSLTLGVAGAILSEAYVSFLGLGVQAPTASWGNMLTEAQEFQIIRDAPWYWFFPGLLILLTVLSINFVGDGLRDALDPRSDKKV